MSCGGRRVRLRAVLAAVALTITGAQSAGGRGPAGPDAPGCELHVWPSPGPESSTEGWLRNQARNEALRDERGGLAEVGAALPPSRQLAVLASLDLAGALGLPGARLVAHPDPLPPAPTGAPAVRHAASTGPCHAELIVRRLVFARSGLAGAALQGFFVFREFADGDVPVRSFTGSADAPLAASSRRTPEEREAGRADLIGAFRADVLTFASRAGRPRSGRR